MERNHIQVDPSHPYLRAYLASVQTIWVVLGGLKGRWVVLFDRQAYLASVYVIWVVLGGLKERGVAW